MLIGMILDSAMIVALSLADILIWSVVVFEVTTL
jgi:hypothetical protein